MLRFGVFDIPVHRRARRSGRRGARPSSQYGRRRRHRRRFERRRVPGATIALTHTDTSTTTTVVSDEKGQYRTAPLRIGEYTVTVELPGSRPSCSAAWC
jgi:hypothetical protein